MPDQHDAGDILGPLDIAREPVKAIGGTAQHGRCFRGTQDFQNPGVLRPAALARIDDQRALAQRDARQPARHDADVLASQDEGPKIDMARRDTALDEGRAGRQRERRLGDIVLRRALSFAAKPWTSAREHAARPACRNRPSHGLLDHELGQMSST